MNTSSWVLIHLGSQVLSEFWIQAIREWISRKKYIERLLNTHYAELVKSESTELKKQSSQVHTMPTSHQVV